MQPVQEMAGNFPLEMTNSHVGSPGCETTFSFPVWTSIDTLIKFRGPNFRFSEFIYLLENAGQV